MVMNYQIISFLPYCNKTTGQWIKIIFHMAEQISLAEFDHVHIKSCAILFFVLVHCSTDWAIYYVCKK